MEFQFNINNLLKDEVSLVDNTLTPCNYSISTRSEYKKQLNLVLDQMGEASAKAQGLHGAITSGSKLAYSDHHLYIMKEPEANGGLGAVVGLLKVGTKKLFIYDLHGGQHEMDPLCVLDFYVHESRQRKGYGKKLFEKLLETENIKVQHLAIDRPSSKFLGFLYKHYHLKANIPQVNNFVVFEGFFRDRQDLNLGRRVSPNKPPMHPYRKPGGATDHTAGDLGGRSSSQRLQQMEREKQALSRVPVPRSGSRENTDLLGQRTGSLGGLDSRNMAAQQSMYSRHGSAGRVSSAGSPMISNNTPPLLRRDGPPRDYLQLNGESSNPLSYTDSRGHLRLTPSATMQRPPQLNQQKNMSSSSSETSVWVPPEQRRYVGNQKYQHTRLW